MAFVSRYEYDLFVSYAHADNVERWVTEFVDVLKKALLQRLGGQDARVFFDTSDTRANSQLSGLLAAVENSALFLAIGSPSYAGREWPRDELDTFVRRVSDPSRLFMIECLPLGEGESYPPPLDTQIRFPFWRPSGPRPIAMAYSPVTDAEEFRPLVHSLAADIKDKLVSLRLLSRADEPSKVRLSIARDSDAEANAFPKPAGSAKKVILLAQVTDDVEDERDQLRSYLKQYEDEIIVLPEAGYPQGGEAFKAALSWDLSRADLFVQLLGSRAGRTPPDLLEGYTHQQVDSAKAAGVPILQWRHPGLDPESITDLQYKKILAGDTVIASGLEAFKRYVLKRIRTPQPAYRPPRSATVFIDADKQDLEIANEIQKECLRQSLTTILPMNGPSSEANRRDLADNLTDCDALFFIYGNTTQDWIRSQLRFFSKVKPKRETEPRILAICSGPPPKPEPGITVPNARVIVCPDQWNIEPIRSLIAELEE
jgi:hypothetical protein